MVVRTGSRRIDPADVGDRLIITLDIAGPFELSGLTESFSALARMFDRLHADENVQPAKLYVTKLRSGSIIAEIAPFALMFGTILPYAESSIVVADFTKRIINGLKAFADIEPADEPPTREDASDIREFIKPVIGKRNASLGLKHARIVHRDMKRQTETVAEYNFGEAEINRAAVNIDAALADTLVLPPPAASERIFNEVMMFFHQVNRSPGKEQPKTGDKAIIPDIYEKPLPVGFRKGVNDLKMRMIGSDENPLRLAFVVDVHVQYVNGEPKAYLVTDLHSVVPLDDED